MQNLLRDVLIEVIGNESSWQIITVDVLDYLLTILLSVVAIILVIRIFIFINHKVTKKYLEKVSKARAVTIVGMIDNLIKYSLGIMGIFILLINFGFDAKVLLTGAGAGALIIGIAAQELIQDFINGIFTVIEGYYDIGDYIEVNNYEGTVIDLGIKTTTLRTNENYIITLPNSLITEIKNLTRDNINIFYEIHTSYEAGVDEIKNIIISKLIPLFEKDVLVEEAIYSGVQGLNDSSVSHMVSITCKPINRYQVKRNLNLIVKEQFEKYEIEIPYSKITVYEGKDE